MSRVEERAPATFKNTVTLTDKLLMPHGTVTQASNHTTGVTINATSGIITLAAVALNAATNAEFTVTNSKVDADSVILVSVQDENTTNNTSIVATTHTIADGSFVINLQNPQSSGNTSATASKIHFLVINQGD